MLCGAVARENGNDGFRGARLTFAPGNPQLTGMTKQLEFGLDTFGDVTRAANGQLKPHAQVIRDVIDEAVLADSLGVDMIGLGEHHRADFAISAPETVLAAIAARTRNIRLA